MSDSPAESYTISIYPEDRDYLERAAEASGLRNRSAFFRLVLAEYKRLHPESIAQNSQQITSDLHGCNGEDN